MDNSNTNTNTNTTQTPQDTTTQPQSSGRVGETKAPTKALSGKWIAAMMAGPLLGAIVIVLLYAVVNFLASLAGVDAASSGVVKVVNVMLFMVGAVAVMLGPISFVVGLVFLVMRLSGKK